MIIFIIVYFILYIEGLLGKIIYHDDLTKEKREKLKNDFVEYLTSE